MQSMPWCEGHWSVCLGAMSMAPIKSLTNSNFLLSSIVCPLISFSKVKGSSAVFYSFFLPVFTQMTWSPFFLFAKPRAIKLLCSLHMATKCSVDCSLGWGDWVANGKTSWEWLEELSYSGNTQLLSWRKLRTKGADSSLFNCYRPNKFEEEGKAGTLIENVAFTLKWWSSAQWDLASSII